MTRRYRREHPGHVRVRRLNPVISRFRTSGRGWGCVCGSAERLPCAPLEPFEHVEQDPFVPTPSDERAVQRGLTLAIAPVMAREPVIPRQDALEDRRVAASAAPKAAGLDCGER